MWVGNELRFIHPKWYKDPKTGRLTAEPLPKTGKDIYIWWTYKYYRRKDGGLSIYKHLHYSKAGIKETYYCKNGEHYPDEFADNHWFDFLDSFTFLMANPANFQRAPKTKKRKKRNGRPKVFSEEIYELFKSAGFRAKGNDIMIHYKSYLSLSCCEFRFNLLSEADRKAIGSPERLLELCKKSYSLLKSRNRRSINTSFEQCFRDTAVGELDSPVYTDDS